jgi:hypothetical protein
MPPYLIVCLDIRTMFKEQFDHSNLISNWSFAVDCCVERIAIDFCTMLKK